MATWTCALFKDPSIDPCHMLLSNSIGNLRLIPYPGHVIQLIMVDGIFLDSFENLKVSESGWWHNNHYHRENGGGTLGMVP